MVANTLEESLLLSLCARVICHNIWGLSYLCNIWFHQTKQHQSRLTGLMTVVINLLSTQAFPVQL